MSADLNLAFDAHVLDVERIFLRLFGQPVRRSADEISGKKRYALLQKNGGVIRQILAFG